MKRFFRPAAAVLALAAAFFLLPHDLLAANSCVWNSTTGDWTDVARWSSCGGTFPGAADSASISGGTVTLSTSHSVTGVTFTAGTIDGAGNLNVSGAFAWSGGTMGGTGTTTVASGGTLTLSGVVQLARVLTNNGTVTLGSGGGINLGDGTINNNAAFNVTTDSTLGNNGGTNAFNNNASGTLTRNGGTGNLDINVPFTNAGTTTISTGTLRLNTPGGSSTGTISVPSGSTIVFNNNYDVTSGSFTVGGTLSLNGGTINMTPTTYTVTGTTSLGTATYNLNKASASSSWNQSSGTLGGSGNITISSSAPYAWSGGTMGGTGTTTVASGGTLTLSGVVQLARVLTNNGTVTLGSGGGINLGDGTINNNAAFNVTTDSTLGNNGGTNAFNNNASGTLTRNGGTGNLDINVPFTNAGTTTISTGTLRLNTPGGSSTGTISVPSGSTIVFNNNYDVTSGSFTVGGTLSLNGGTINMTPTTYTVTGTTSLGTATYNLNKASASSSWNQSSGTLGGSGNITISSSAPYAWSGGTMGGTGTTTVASGGTLTLSGVVQLARVLTNNGTVTLGSGGGINLGDGTINNNAAFNVTTDSTLGNNGGTNAFNNNASGTLTRNGGTGNLDINVPFTNAGTTTISTGTLRLNTPGGSSTGTISVPSGSTIVFNNNYDVTSGSFTVGGTLSLNGGTINMTPTTYTVTGTTSLGTATYNLNKASASSSWNQSSGTLGGSGNITISSSAPYAWSGGTMGGTGTTTVASGGTLTLSGVVQLARVLTNNGTVTLGSGGGINLGDGTINNNAAFNVTTDSTLGNNGGTNAFNNNASGTLTRNGGTGNLDINVPFTNAGTTTISTGTLRLNTPGGSSTGTISVPSGSTIVFNNNYDVTSGSFTVGGTLSLNGGTINMTPTTYTVTGTTSLGTATYNLNKASASSSWNQSSGTLGGSGNITISSSAPYAWSGGTMGGTGTTTVASGGTLTLSGVVQLARVLTNNGTVTLGSGGGINLGDGTINNNAAFNVTTDSTLGNNGGTNAFNNNASGTLTRNGGTGNLDINVPFTNAGTLNANSGTLRFNAVFTQTAGLTVLNGGDLASTSGLNIQGGTLKGKGTITGNVFNGGTVAPGLSPGILTVTGNYSQTAAGTLAVEINGLTAGTQYDQLVVNGTVALAGALTVTSGFTPSAGDGFAILVNDATDAVVGDFAGLPESAVLTGGATKYRITYVGVTGNDVVLEAGPAASAQSVLVDATASAGGASDGNGVFEPGETVGIKPTWKNQGTDPISLSGAASNFTGPGAAGLYSIADAAAVYGSMAVNATADCGSNCYSLMVADPAARPTTHWDAHFTETPSTLADPPKVWTLHLGDSFIDVPRSQLFYKRIETLVHNGITSGCATGKYCPSDAVTRDQMAIFLAKGIAGGGPQVPVSGSFQGHPYNCVNGGTSLFTDVQPTDSFCKHVHYMAVQNVTLGCSGTTFCPHGAISRSDMAIFVAKAIAAPGGGAAVPQTYTDAGTGLTYSCNPASPNLHFTDIGTSDTFCKHVHFLWARGIVSGCAGTNYCPTQGVTRDQMARFLGNAFDLLLYAP